MTTRICVTPDYNSAPEPSGVKANPSALQRTPLLRLLHGIGTILQSSARRVIASALRAGASLHDRIAAGLLEFFGPVEIEIGGYWCSHCEDVHKDGYRCHRALRGICTDCNRWRTLNRFGMCPSGHSSVVKRELRWPEARKQAEFLHGERT